MESSFGIYVVLTTILTMEASAYPYVPYSGQPQGFYGQKQWGTPQSEYTNQVQPGYFQQPTQDWTSRGYQPSNYESNLYNSAPAPSIYQSSLGYSGLSRPSTSNSYGSSMGDPYPQQTLPQQTQTQDFGNTDDQSKFKIFHLDLPNSPNSRTLQLPITGDPSRFRVVHMNQGAATEVEPTRSSLGVSGDALNALSRVNLELENIKMNPGAYRETDYLKGSQQSLKQSTSYTNIQPVLSGTSGYGNQGGTYSNGKSYAQSNQNLGGLYPQQGVSSDAQADASSVSGNLGAGYNDGESYPPNTQNYRNQEGASSLPGTIHRVSQPTVSTSSGARSPPEAFTGDLTYPIVKESYGNQGEVYTNRKAYPNNDNSQPDSAKQDVYPKNVQSYPVNYNPQGFGNQEPIAPNSDGTYPVNSNVWKNLENNGGLPDSGKPNRGNIVNRQGSGFGDQPLTNSEYLSNIGKEQAPISNIGRGQTPVTEDESPNGAKTHTPLHTLPIQHRHIPVNNPSQSSLTSTAEASAATVSQGGNTRTQPIAPDYRHPHYHHNSPHQRPHHSPSINFSPRSSQTTAQSSSSSVSQNPASNKPANNLHIHGGPPIAQTQPPNSDRPLTYKIPIRGGPDKFRNRFTTQPPNLNGPDSKRPVNADSSKVQPGFSDQPQPQPNDSYNAPSGDQNGATNSAFAPQYSPADSGFSDVAYDQQDLGDSSIPVNVGTQPDSSPPENINAPKDNVFSSLIPSFSSLVPTDEGTSSPTEYLPSPDVGGFKNTQPELNDSQFPALTNTYYDDGTDSTGSQLTPIEPYKPPSPTAFQDDGNSSPKSQSDGTNISNPDQNFANSQGSSDNPSLPSSDGASPSKNSPSTTDKATTEAPKNTKGAPNTADDGAGLLITDSSESTDSTTTKKVSSSSNTAKTTKTSSIFKRINKNKRNKTKEKLSSTSSSTRPTEKPKPTSNDNLDDDSLDLDALQVPDKDTKNNQDTLESLQYLGISTENLDNDNIDDAENSAKGVSSSSGALGQDQAGGSGVSKTARKSSCPKFGSLFHQAGSDDTSYYSKPLRGLLKIIATLEKIFGGTNK